MSGFFEFIAIYQCATVYPTQEKIVVDPVKLIFFRGPKNLSVALQTSAVTLRSQDLVCSTEQLLLPEGSYFSLTARTKADHPSQARAFCEAAIDRAVLNISLITDPSIFSNCIYRGWLVSKERSIHESWVKHVESTLIDSKCRDRWLAVNAKQNEIGDHSSKIDLMAKYYSKAISSPPGEEKFLYLWTILEIWPMSGTSDIRPISDRLGEHMSKDPKHVKESLEIGRFFGYRSKLLHDGVFPIPLIDMGRSFSLLEDICKEVLRCVSGLEYAGALDKYI